MKRTFLRIHLILTLTVSFYMGNAQAPPSPGPGIRGVANFLISAEIAQDYIKNFDKYFRNNPTDFYDFPPSYEIDYCYIDKFTNMLEIPSAKYTGFSFVFGTDKTDGNKVSLYLLPTTTLPNRKKMEHYYVPINIAACNFRHNGNTKDMRKAFEEVHRKEGQIGQERDNLSKSIWIDAVVMKFIRDTIKNFPPDDSLKLIGINVYNASYDKKVAEQVGQKHDIQSTVIIVFKAYNKNTGQIFDYWNFNESLLNAYNNKYDSKNKISTFSKHFTGKVATMVGDALNHGELCPDNCPPPIKP